MIKKTIYRKKVEKKEIQKETRSQILNEQTHTHTHSHIQDAKPNHFFANSL